MSSDIETANVVRSDRVDEIRLDSGPEEAPRIPKPLGRLTSTLRGLYVVLAVQGIVTACAWLLVYVEASAQSESGVQLWGRFIYILGLVTLPLMILTAVLFVTWFYRAYRNLWVANVVGLHYSPGWAVAGWFIPFVNLVLPPRIAEDLWRGSHGVGMSSGRGAPDATLVRSWWRRTLAAAFLPLFALAVISASAGSGSRGGVLIGIMLMAVSCSLAAAAAIAVRQLVSKVGRDQGRWG